MDDNNLVGNDEDKIKSVQEIIKNVNENAEEDKKTKPKRKYTKKKKPDVKLEPVPEVIEQIQELTTKPFENEDDYKKKLCEDLEVLKYKFENVITYKPQFSYPETSINELERQKSLFMRLVNEKASVNAVFESLLFVVKGGEKVSNSLGLIDINGLTEDLNDKRTEIIEILKELVDTGLIDCCELTPELKLIMLLTNLTIARMEKNKSMNLAMSQPSFLESMKASALGQSEE
jgi:predicted nucleic acid-binding protein